jgi:2-keto-4-pentenoate hydratase
MMTGAREEQLTSAADLLLDSRRTGKPLEAWPVELQPTTLDEAYFLQDRLAAAYGKIGGWKIGAPTADATPIFAPMPSAWIAPNAAVVRGARRFRGLEAEIAFLIGNDLPPRATPYSMDEVVESIASCHPAIEVLESALLDPLTAERLMMIGDLQMNGGFVYGPAIADWKKIDFKLESVTIAVDGVVRVERTGSNTSGNLLRLLPWIANEGSVRTHGVKAGQWVTTGSWTGVTVADPRSEVHVKFSTAGEVRLRFE